MAFDVTALLNKLYRFLRTLDGPVDASPAPEPLRIHVLPDHGSFAQGEIVSGNVLVRGGPELGRLRDLALYVEQEETVNGAQRLVQHLKISLAEEVTLGERDTVVPFSFRMPADMRMSEDEEGVGRVGQGCRLTVTAMNAFGDPVHGGTSVNVQISPNEAGLLRAMRECGFAAAGPTFEDGDGRVHRQFEALPSLSAWLSSAGLTVEVKDGRVYGRLRLTPGSNSLTERVQAFMGNSRSHEVLFEVSSTDLVTPDGWPNVEGAAVVIRRALADSMLLGDSARTTLLRASEAAPENLLHPAPSPPTAVDRLLQAVPGPPASGNDPGRPP